MVDFLLGGFFLCRRFLQPASPHQALQKKTGCFSLKHPKNVQYRITNYDGQFVSFWYDRLEDGMRQDETIPAFEFIGRLIRHISQKYFNTLRYYGLYAKKHKFVDQLVFLLTRHVVKARLQCRKWAFRIELAFGCDPTKCSCGNYMEFLGVFRPGDLAFRPPYLYNSLYGRCRKMTKHIYMKKSEFNKITAEKLRTKYIDNPPDGYTKSEIISMSDDSILDMDYFLHEEFYDCWDEELYSEEPDEIIHLIDDLPKDPDEDDFSF